MFDVTQWGDEGYKEYKLDYGDWQTIHQTRTSAKMTNLTEGTKYPTLPLVLPMITHVIQHAEKPTLIKPQDKMSSFGVLTQPVQAARRAFIEDLHSKWIDNLPSEQCLLITATFLDPCFKSFEFPWHGGRTAGLRPLQEQSTWKGGAADASSTIVEHKKAEAKNLDDVLTSFLDETGDEEENIMATAVDTELEFSDSDQGHGQLLDELESYLQTPDAPKQMDILAWWKEKSMWSKLQSMA